ncbi:DUF4190 domain-containing protein [Streptomyces sp. NPDC051921]|uniref:DUF4190 domain-containing protein n=1 Tax=Streptomyces sp. NPDC051921 TaxID=3155806 RepID=UPI00344A4C42
MSENNDQPVDPWAPPNQDGVELSKPAPGAAVPPQVHNQPTVASMPGAELPPPPAAPGATGAGFGLPTGPAAPQQPGYGYPAAPAASYPGYGAGYPGGYGQPGWTPAPSNGMGTAAMVLGILAVVLAFCSYGVLGLILGGVALGLGIAAKKKSDRGEATNRGQAVAGITLGAIGLALGVAGIALIIFIATHADEWDKSDSGDDPWSTRLTVASAPR